MARRTRSCPSPIRNLFFRICALKMHASVRTGSESCEIFRISFPRDRGMSLGIEILKISQLSELVCTEACSFQCMDPKKQISDRRRTRSCPSHHRSWKFSEFLGSAKDKILSFVSSENFSDGSSIGQTISTLVGSISMIFSDPHPRGTGVCPSGLRF